MSLAEIKNYAAVHARLLRPANAVTDRPIDLKERPVHIVALHDEATVVPIQREPMRFNPFLEGGSLRNIADIKSLPAETFPQRTYPPVKAIVATVAQLYKVTPLDILSARRTKNVVRPRQVAMYLARTFTPKSLPDIGQQFAGRDHTTILHAVRKITALVTTDDQLKQEIGVITAKLTELMARRYGVQWPADDAA